MKQENVTVYDKQGYRMHDLNVQLIGSLGDREAGWIIGSSFYPWSTMDLTDNPDNTSTLTHKAAGWFLNLK